MSISDILRKLLGKIEPYGDTNIDKERYNNILNYYEALSFIISELENASKSKDRNEHSMQKIGNECYDILKEFGLENNND